MHCERIIDVLHEMSITAADQLPQIEDDAISHQDDVEEDAKDAYVDVEIVKLKDGWTVFGRCLASRDDGKPMKFCNLYCNHDRVCQCALSIDEEEYIEFVKTSIQDHHVDFVCENACVSINESDIRGAIRA